MHGTYPPIRTIRIFRTLQHFTMAVGNNGADAHNVILDARNKGVGVCDIMMSGRNGCICVSCKFLLEVES